MHSSINPFDQTTYPIGKVSREELAASLDDRASKTSALRAFLDKIASSQGVELSHGYGALFDMIEGDDDGGLSWSEFEAFFLAIGWTQTQTLTQTQTGSEVQRSQTASLASSRRAPGSKAGAGPGGATVRPGDITYVVEKCEVSCDLL